MKRFLLLITDIAALYASLFITLSIRYGDAFRYQFEAHLVPFSIIFVIWVIAFYITNLYEIGGLRNGIGFYSNQLRAVAIAGSLSLVFFYLIPFFGITPKTNLFIFMVVFTGIGLATRTLMNNALEGGFKKPLIIVGVNPQVAELSTFIRSNPQLGYELKYVVDISPTQPSNSDVELMKFGIIKGSDNLRKIINNETINTIVVSPEAYREAEIINIFYNSLGNKITFRNLSSFYEDMTSRVPLGAINQMWFLENLSEGSKTGYEMAKRLTDTVFALVLGIITVILLPFLAITIKLDSSGPVFYRQKRVGRAGKIFEIIKLRTMKDRAEANTGAVWASENDPRTTRIGRFLRQMRLDEIPQLWNILKGEMSFVGPRAERPEFHDDLRSGVQFYEERYLIKPGLTGWAQIHFRYGSSVADAAEKLQYDLYYIKNRSILLDLGIILKTINIALRQAGR